MPLIVVFFFMLFLASTTQLETIRDDARQEHLAESRHSRTIKLAELVARYLEEKGGTPPADLATLAATPGFTQAQQFLNTGPHGDGPFLAVYPGLPKGENTYTRVIVYTPPQDGSISATDYLTASFNNCGTTAAGNPATWCGNPTGSWWMTETHTRITGELSRERAQQQQTLQKFAKAYNVILAGQQVFPELSTPGDNQVASLISQLTGYNGLTTAATCTGVWTWQNIPLTCEDLYTVWGTPRLYNYKTAEHIVLYAEAPWKEGGQPIIVASQLDSRR